MSERDGGPAFPSKRMGDSSGMTLRDWFAGQALTGVMQPDIAVSILERADAQGVRVGKVAAKMCYELADAMLKEREKKDES